jgi:hypothetical protein
MPLETCCRCYKIDRTLSPFGRSQRRVHPLVVEGDGLIQGRGHERIPAHSGHQKSLGWKNVRELDSTPAFSAGEDMHLLQLPFHHHGGNPDLFCLVLLIDWEAYSLLLILSVPGFSTLQAKRVSQKT